MTVDIRNIRLYENDEIVEFNRDVDIGEHLPQDTIGKGAEFTHIRHNENIELSRLFGQINRLMRNTFIQSSESLGLDYYEKLLGVKVTGDLEERRRKIYALWNSRVVWTHRTLIEWLNKYVGVGNYVLDLHYNDYKIEFKIIVSSRIDTDQIWLRKQLRMIIPANLRIIWTLVYDQKIYYALVEQRGYRVKIYPNTAEDTEKVLPVRYAAGVYTKKITSTDLPMGAWTIDDYGLKAAVAGEKGERVIYG